MSILWLLAPWFAVSVAAGDGFTCALTREHTVRCWGTNTTAEVGDGTTTQRGIPVEIAGLREVSQIASGSHTCVVEHGGLQCWGGDFWVGEHTRPRPIQRYGAVSSVAVGSEFTCAIGSDRHARCGGTGEDEQL